MEGEEERGKQIRQEGEEREEEEEETTEHVSRWGTPEPACAEGEEPTEVRKGEEGACAAGSLVTEQQILL